MKFSAVLFAGFAAVSQVQANPEAQPEAQLGDILDTISDVVADIGDTFSDVRTAFESWETHVEELIEDSDAAWSDIRASITGGYNEIIASLSAIAETNSNYEAAQSDIARYSSQIDDIVAEASQAVEENRDDETDDEARASFASAAVALAGVVGGAALFMNL